MSSSDLPEMSQRQPYKEPLSVKVTAMKNHFIATLYNEGKVRDRRVVFRKCDIGYACRDMMRWFSKMGGISKWAEAARRRHNEKDYKRTLDSPVIMGRPKDD